MTLYICGFRSFKETLQLVNACRYSKEAVARQLQSQKKKQLPASLPKGEFQLVSVSNDGVGAALYRFNDTAACRDVGSINHGQLPTPNQSTIHLSLSLPLELGINLGHAIVYGTDMEWEVVSGNKIN